MNGVRSPQFQNECTFLLIDLHDEAEVQALLEQRKICGWNYTREWIDKWRNKSDAKEKSLFWVVLPSQNNARAGHISLDSLIDTPDKEIQNSDRSIMIISNFFIMPEYRKFGLGRKSMDIIEDLATKEPYGSPNCKAIVVDTLSRGYFYDPELMQEWKRAGFTDFDGSATCNEDWYARRGYVKWKEERKYDQSNLQAGEPFHLMASFLKKDLQV